jgi:hypothetical protein
MDYDIDPSDNSDDPVKLGPMWAWSLIYLIILLPFQIFILINILLPF